MSNIDKFIKNISRYGVLTTNRFKVIVNDSQRLGGSSGFHFSGKRNELEILPDRIEQIRLPGINLSTLSTKRYGTGIDYKHVNNFNSGNISFTVLSDEKYNLYNFFYEWMKKAFEFEDNSNIFLVGYKDDYTTTINVDIFDQANNFVVRYNFLDCFPVSLSEPDLSWGAQNNLHRLSIGIEYSTFSIEK